MQDLVLIISRCLSNKKFYLDDGHFYKFHFRGYYQGQKIKLIHIHSAKFNSETEQLSKGDDYLLWVKRRKIIKQVLEVELIKYKKII